MAEGYKAQGAGPKATGHVDDLQAVGVVGGGAGGGMGGRDTGALPRLARGRRSEEAGLERSHPPCTQRP